MGRFLVSSLCLEQQYLVRSYNIRLNRMHDSSVKVIEIDKALEAGSELGECQGGPLPPQNFAWPPQWSPQNFLCDVMPLH